MVAFILKGSPLLRCLPLTNFDITVFARVAQLVRAGVEKQANCNELVVLRRQEVGALRADAQGFKSPPGH